MSSVIAYGLSYVPYVLVSIELTKRFFRRISNAFDALFSPTYFLFYEGSYQPYVYHLMNPLASGSAHPVLMYNADTQLFFPWVDGYSFKELQSDPTSCLPILSLEIVDRKNGKAYYDLTDFVEKVRFVHVANSTDPTVWHVISAWSLSSGIVPCHDSYTVRWIDGNGKTIEVPFYTEVDTEASETTEASEGADSPAPPPVPA